MTPSRVLLIKGQSRYDVLRDFIDAVAAAFQARGIEPVVLDSVPLKTHDEISTALKAVGPVDLAFSFYIFGHYVDPDRRTLGEIIGAPVVVQYVDYPLSLREALDGTDSTSAILTVDPSHADAIRKLYGPNRFAHLGFNPHAGTGEPFALPASAAEFVAGRPIPIFFSGTYYRPVDPPWKDFPANIRHAFDEAADYAVSQEFVPALDALDTTLKRMGLDPNVPDPSVRQVRLLADKVHEWVRSLRRHRFFEAAAKVGLPLTVYGSGYDADLPRFPNIDYRGLCGFHDAIRLMQQSRMVININANFGRGSHERPFTAMLAGAVAASDTSTYYTEQFDAGREMMLFRWQHLEQDLSKLRDLVEDPARLFAIAQAGQHKTARNHRWANRIDTIIAAAGEAD
ncbi:MAG TPA: glycosyltransferase [Rhizomicrobium sp.]|nr:glycosyltransferase [Rhizomicrobium sp.]